MDSREFDFQSPCPCVRRLLSAVSLVILGTILWCNVPDEFRDGLFARTDNQLSPMNAYRVRYAEWMVRYSANIVGFDQKWQMYGSQSRFNWNYVFCGHYGDGSRQANWVLPIPRQSERTTLQRNLIDFREAKFLLNIYNDPVARESYSRYLARQFPEYDGLPINSISISMGVQYILPPLVAVQQQQLLEKDTYYDVINTFDVRRENRQMAAVDRLAL